MWRAIRRIRSGETIEMQHTDDLEDAWRWLQPGPQETIIDKWFVISLEIVQRRFEESPFLTYLLVGSNERVSYFVDIFLQKVDSKQDELPFRSPKTSS